MLFLLGRHRVPHIKVESSVDALSLFLSVDFELTDVTINVESTELLFVVHHFVIMDSAAVTTLFGRMLEVVVASGR